MPEKKSETAVYSTHELCWKCRQNLYRLVPPTAEGCEYYCDHCQMLTATREALDRAMAQKDPLSVGVVAAIGRKLTIHKV